VKHKYVVVLIVLVGAFFAAWFLSPQINAFGKKKLVAPAIPTPAPALTATSSVAGANITPVGNANDSQYHKSELTFQRNCKPDPLPTDMTWKDRVNFSEPKEVFTRISSSVVSTLQYDGATHFCSTNTYTMRFFDFGSVKAGPYQGARLITSRSDYLEPACEAGGDTFGVTYQMFLQQGNRLIELTLLSEEAHNKQFFQDALQSLKMDLSTDDKFNIPMFGNTLSHISVNGVCLNYSERLPEERDKPIKTIGTHPIYGDFYLAGNYVHAKLPDGTVMSYYLLPPEELDFMDGTSKDEYACFGEPGKREASGTADLVSYAPDIKDDDLKELRTTPHLGKLYIPKNPDNPLVQTLYGTFKTDYERYQQYKEQNHMPVQPETEKLSPYLNFDEYKKQTPVFYWRDPLGRWIHCENKSLRVPSMAEPLIYLYPTQEQNVEVGIDERVNLRESIPVLENHMWKVKAIPSGDITFTKDGSRYPYLYWEGKYAPLASPTHGFVVEKENVGKFLEETLPKLGLNEKESKDFRGYWVPKMADHPYYLVSFLDEATITEMAPLHVSPQPATMIRVMMDFRPLNSPEKVPPIQLASPKKRTGFTVVEWGGMSR